MGLEEVNWRPFKKRWHQFMHPRLSCSNKPSCSNRSSCSNTILHRDELKAATVGKDVVGPIALVYASVA